MGKMGEALRRTRMTHGSECFSLSRAVTFSLFIVTSDISPELISCANGLKF